MERCGMRHSYNGVLTKKSSGFILYNDACELNLSEELKSFWKMALPTHIKIETNNRVLLDQTDEEIYYDKNSKGIYQLHICDICIDDVLERAIYKQIYITIEVGKDYNYGTADSES
jgi:hypothetical protein